MKALRASLAENARLAWRYGQPALLKTAGVIGLAGVIVTVISSAFTYEERASAGQDAPPLERQEAPLALAQSAPAVPVRIAAPTPALPASKPAVAAAAPAAPAPPSAVAPGSGAQVDATAYLPEETPNCLHEEVADAALADASERSVACRSTPAVAALTDESTIVDAVAQPSDGTSASFIAPVPRPRPEPPPARVKTAARGKLPPPPDCGNRHARWRYNSERQPVWYCK
jgi:hypothetical protein